MREKRERERERERRERRGDERRSRERYCMERKKERNVTVDRLSFFFVLSFSFSCFVLTVV